MVVTLADITDPEKCLLIPRIPSDQIRGLWLTDYRDGPRSGMLMYRGEECWYEIVAEYEEGASLYRRFAVLRLSPEQLADEKRWHEQLQKRVGKGRDFDWFIDEYRNRTLPNYTACEVLGWFEI